MMPLQHQSSGQDSYYAPQPPESYPGNVTNEDDILYLLSGIFDNNHASNENDDLSSIMSWNEEVTQEFMNPIPF